MNFYLILLFCFIKKSIEENLSYTGAEKEISDLQGTYEFKLWGAQGGGGYKDGIQESEGGKGAYVYGKIHFPTKTTLTVLVGGKGNSSEKGPNNGGWPNGGKGGEDTGLLWDSDDASGGGGGSTSLLLGNTQLLVAGAGAGGVMNVTGCEGGEFYTLFCPGVGDTCVLTGEKAGGNSNGYGGDGVDSSFTPGSGGGGGYYGGAASGNYAIDSPGAAMACSGSSYYNPDYVTDESASSGKREGDGYFEYNLIASCPSNCENCPISSTCETCYTGFKLYENNCYEDCPEGSYQTGPSSCASCIPNCSYCSSSDTCNICMDGFKVYKSKCYETYPIGTYETADAHCLSCSSNCIQCSSNEKCDKCETGYVLRNKQCINKQEITKPIHNYFKKIKLYNKFRMF